MRTSHNPEDIAAIDSSRVSNKNATTQGRYHDIEGNN
jgi:hypothetical protein